MAKLSSNSAAPRSPTRIFITPVADTLGPAPKIPATSHDFTMSPLLACVSALIPYRFLCLATPANPDNSQSRQPHTRKGERITKYKHLQTFTLLIFSLLTSLLFCNFIGITYTWTGSASLSFSRRASFFPASRHSFRPQKLAPWEEIYDVVEVPSRGGGRVTLVGNCEQYIAVDNMARPAYFDGQVLQFHDIAEQLTSALLPLHSVMRLANSTNRALVGPFITIHNRYSSFPDIPPDSDTLATGSLPSSFITQFWDISPLFEVYSNLCLIAHQDDIQDTCNVASRMTLRISSEIDGDTWIRPTYRELQASRDVDVAADFVDTAQPWRETQCVYYRGAARYETHGDPNMRIYNGPRIPHPSFYVGYEQVFADFDKTLQTDFGASDIAIGVGLFTFFTPSLRIVHLASKLTQWVSSAENYIGVHLRLERVYNQQAGPFSSDCTELSDIDAINPCLVQNCPPENIVNELTQQITDFRKGGGLLYPPNEKWPVFVARDFGKNGGSSTLGNSSLAADQYESLLSLANVGSLLIEYSAAQELDPSTAGLVDLVLLSDATDCVQVGRGSFNSLVNFYRQAKGRTPCQVIQRTSDFGRKKGDQPCRLEPAGRSVLVDDASWRVILGTSKGHPQWQDIRRRR